MIVSFDFDMTLSNNNFAQRLFMSMRHDPRVTFHIVTQRYGPLHAMSEASEVLDMASRLKIRPENVHFTNRADKWPVVKAIGAMMHVDDDYEQLSMIGANCPGCLTVSSI